MIVKSDYPTTTPTPEVIDGGLGELIEVILAIDGEEEIELEEDTEPEFDANLAESMDEGDLDSLGSELVGHFTADVADRKDWVEDYIKGVKLLGLKYEDRTMPWPGACGAFHPLLAEAVVRFQADSIQQQFPAAGPVKTKIIGRDTKEKRDAAKRVQEDMNHQLTDLMTEFRSEHEKMLWSLALAGSAFKKVYFDPLLGRQTSIFIDASDFVVPFGASSLPNAERVTHVMRKTPNEVIKLQAAGFYVDFDLGDPSGNLDEIQKEKATGQGYSASTDNRFKLLEMHVDLDLKGHEDEDGIALPYVVTIDKDSMKVLGIRRNWEEQDPLRLRRQHFVAYTYVPGTGFYGLGLIALVGSYTESATSILRQLVDSGTLANLQAGYKTRGMRIKGDDTPLSPGEFRDADVSSGTLRDNILPLPYKEPSQTLFMLMQNIVQDGRAFASAADAKISDMSAASPVGTTLAIMERTLKVMSAIQARMHYSMKMELKLLAGIIRDYTPDSYEYQPEDGEPQIKQADYDLCEVIPVSDVNASTMAQKILTYQAALQLAQGAPQIYDLPKLHKQMLEVLGIREAGKLVPTSEDQLPTDPVSENMALLNGKPVKAFQFQDHEAHIAVHQAAMQDPKIAALVGQNPMAQALMAVAQAHLMEHVAFGYKAAVEAQMGMPIETATDEKPMAPDVEVRVSQMAAQAAQKLLQQNQQQAAQQQAQQANQDPIVQLQQQEQKINEREVAVKEKDVQLKGVKIMADIKLADEKNETAKAAMLIKTMGGIASQEQSSFNQGAALAEKTKMENKKLGVSALTGLMGHMSKQPPTGPTE